MRKRRLEKTFYLSEEEDNMLKEKAIKVGYNESEVIRNLIKNFEPREKPDDRFYDFMKILRSISNNLNQIAIKTHLLGYIDEIRYNKEVDKLEKFILEIKRDFLLPKS
jgi:hypothetical protein